ncbi:hypothetical protein WJX72_010890 [[Myrmecia] bisecta]|uniref:Protein kinase domain-containing protein n=1 Tax=[Myrmecia] bisecta TaxID=41462 RepID=A0AAW1QCH0_9CHLO
MGEPRKMVGEWELTQQIGSGSFAVVWKACHRATGQEVAIKEINTDKLNKKLKQSLESEVSILKQIEHKNIVQLLDVVEERSRLYLIMEYCAGGDLAGYIRRCKRVPEAAARAILQQLGSGLQELWAHHLVHRDLKPQNLLLSDASAQAVLKIADFGFARNLQPQGLAETLCGSPLYMAPEILQFHKYDAKADLWSVGTILYELVTGRPPFNGANHMQLLRNIERCEARIPDQIAAQLSDPCKHLIHNLLKRNPATPGLPRQRYGHSSPGEGHRRPSFESRTEPSRLAATSGQRSPFQQPPRPLLQVTAQPSSSPQQAQQASSSGMSDSLDDDYVIISSPLAALAGQGSSSARSSGHASSSTGNAQQLTRQQQPLYHPLQQQQQPTIAMQQQAQALAASQQLTPRQQQIQVAPPPSLTFIPPANRVEALRRVAHLLDKLAGAKREGSSPQDTLALRLLALQVLNVALEVAGPTKDGPGLEAEQGRIAGEMKAIAIKADETATALADSEAEAELPDVWELVYQCCLTLSKAAAVDELLGNYKSSLNTYSKVGSLFYFMFAEAPNLALEPRLDLAPADQKRLQRYTVCIGTRYTACAAASEAAMQFSRMGRGTPAGSGRW